MSNLVDTLRQQLPEWKRNQPIILMYQGTLYTREGLRLRTTCKSPEFMAAFISLHFFLHSFTIILFQKMQEQSLIDINTAQSLTSCLPGEFVSDFIFVVRKKCSLGVKWTKIACIFCIFGDEFTNKRDGCAIINFSFMRSEAPRGFDELYTSGKT